jgi:hypothetical protein
MGNGVCWLHESASCMRKSITEIQFSCDFHYCVEGKRSGHSVGIVHSWTQAMEFSFLVEGKHIHMHIAS